MIVEFKYHGSGVIFSTKMFYCPRCKCLHCVVTFAGYFRRKCGCGMKLQNTKVWSRKFKKRIEGVKCVNTNL